MNVVVLGQVSQDNDSKIWLTKHKYIWKYIQKETGIIFLTKMLIQMLGYEYLKK